MMDLSFQPYTKFAGQELDWLPMDTEDLYNTNLKKQYQRLKDNNWIDHSFTYKFNSQGFRSDEFDESSPAIMFLGCSITCGIGVPYENTWAKTVANELSMKCYNLGIGGSSNDAAFRMAYTWIPKLKPNICVFCQTFDNRMEIWGKNGPIKNLPERLPAFYFDIWQTHSLNEQILAAKNILAIQSICLQNDVKFIHTNVLDIDYSDLGRDLSHPGIKANQVFAKNVLAKISAELAVG